MVRPAGLLGLPFSRQRRGRLRLLASGVRHSSPLGSMRLGRVRTARAVVDLAELGRVRVCRTRGGATAAAARFRTR
ncbi:hypothetical protein TPA0906_38070 [Streptomyces olivaceus]|nr:hypothetical protein TPA0905_07190 [Streptomyces olivaceus]GHJ01942.1 hypothetical protein TPA0906_38070 [Streptomyces olivaceus]